MLRRKEFLLVLQKAVPPNTSENKALGGILINMYDELAALQRSALAIAKKVATAQVEPIADAPDARSAQKEDDGAGDIAPGNPLPPDIARAMEAANVSPDGEPQPAKPQVEPPPSTSQATSRAKKPQGGGKQS